ncbi:MAG: hypothetical protein JSU65_02350 [Candidatus Zixiibacteriota bacterium]|nr:MAG: hypothetical protein JSU65_02350 [candidate division Zixibacteria bacterium]
MSGLSGSSLAGNGKSWQLLLVLLTFIGLVLAAGCKENGIESSEPSAVALFSSPQFVGEDGFQMPNGKYHKLDCPCNICRAIRLNVGAPCASDTVITVDSVYSLDTVLVFDSTILVDTVAITDTIVQIDTVVAIDTVVVIDTVETGGALTGEWLEFSAYEASKEFVIGAYPERAGDRFSSLGEFCDYTAGTPAGQAGFRFIDNGDGTYSTAGYMFHHMFGDDGYVWVGAPSELSFFYNCLLRLEADGSWTAINVTLTTNGSYVRDTRHD